MEIGLPPAPAPSKEMRERMASMHEKMAACLRSDRAFSECRQGMHQTCSNMMGQQGCPMMGIGNQESRRANVMEKMGANSVAHLVKMHLLLQAET